MGFLYQRKGTRIVIDMAQTKFVQPDEVDSMEKAGYHILELIDPMGDSTFRRSMKSDGLVRSTDAEWHKDVELNVYEQDLLVWEEMVDWWFDNFFADKELVGRVTNTLSEEQLEEFIGSAKRYMKAQKPRANKKGRRETHFYNWLFNRRNSYLSHWLKTRS